jgi:hypothetical protein
MLWQRRCKHVLDDTDNRGLLLFDFDSIQVCFQNILALEFVGKTNLRLLNYLVSLHCKAEQRLHTLGGSKE